MRCERPGICEICSDGFSRSGDFTSCLSTIQSSFDVRIVLAVAIPLVVIRTCYFNLVACFVGVLIWLKKRRSSAKFSGADGNVGSTSMVSKSNSGLADSRNDSADNFHSTNSINSVI